MRIKNATGRHLLLRLVVNGYDPREEHIAPGHESDDFYNVEDGDPTTGDGADVITIEEEVTSCPPS